MGGSPSLHNLVKPTTLGLNHVDLDRLGVEEGAIVSVTGASGSVRLPVELNEGVARGSVEIVFGTKSATGEDAVAVLYDPTSVISQVRLESR